MPLFDLVTLRTELFAAAKAAPALQEWLAAPEAKGTLLGAWAPDIGALNEVVLLRQFESAEDLVAEKTRTHLSDNPFGCMEHLRGWVSDSYIPLEFTLPVAPGEYGKVYEIRSYQPKLNGMAPTIGKWREAVPVRTQYSPLSIAMYSLDGPTRFTQIWPYESANHRAEIRGRTVADGIWPPKGGPDWLSAEMTSTLAVPLPFSPLK
ncbi:NIPSNAP family protein [Poseidonocella sp. HB161398]|uniref:NIPSNAP family protein n=1 Tax=Poseidonocella sp. HB161398 TaxID=2320855 RepID=UPI001109BA9F|nr:NIPSNAP family protein [Poseidonocella sp. HB161398]